MPDFTRLKSVLLSSGLQHQNPALFQVIDNLLTFMGNVPGDSVATAISGGGGGTVGPQGPMGPMGPVGIFGIDGENGEPGFPGPAGATGSAGATGAAGPAGIGIPGIDGIDGDDNSIIPLFPNTNQILDLLGGISSGALLYRDVNVWKLLAPGTAGYFLESLGTGSAPTWAPFSDSPLRTSLQFALFVSAGGAFVGDGPFSGAGTITGTTNAKPTAAFSDTFYWNAATSTTIASLATYIPNTSGTGPINFTWDFDISLVMRTDIVAVTGVRYWFIIGAASSPGNVDTLPSNGIAFRFSTVAGDGGWVGVTFDGTQAVTGTVAAIAANTKYILRIRKVGGTVFFSVNGGTEVSTSSHVPVNDAYCTPVCVVANAVGGAGSARSFYFSRCFGNIGS
jgi:hypothetical protein